MPTSPTSLSCVIGEPACGLDMIDLHTIEYAPGVSFLDEYGNSNTARSLSHDENERARLKNHMDRVRADGFARLRKLHGLTQGTHDMIDTKLVSLANQISLKLDGITSDRDAAIAIIRATSSTKLDELRAKSTEYLGFRAEYSVQSYVRDSAFATAPTARSCGGGCGSHSDGVDAEHEARTRMMRDSRLASSQPLSYTADAYAADARIDEAERCEAIRAKHAMPADHFRAPRSYGSHADGGQDREAVARANMHKESRDAHTQPLSMTKAGK